MLKPGIKALVLVFTLLSSVVLAQNYPTKPVRILIGSSGGATDVINRLFAAELTKRLGQTFIVDNRPGAANSIAAWAVNKSPPDGYMLFGGSALPFHPINIKENSMDASKGLQPVTTMALGESYLMVRGDLAGVDSLKAFAARAKSSSVPLKFASAGVNTQAAMSVVAQTLDFKYTYVPYKETTQATAALLSGDADFTVNTLAGITQHLESGRIRAITNFGASRNEVHPNIPTLKDEGVDLATGFNMSLWAPLGTPKDVIAKIGAAVAAAAKDPSVAEKVKALGMIPRASTPEELARIYLSEVANYTKANEVAGLKPQ